MKIGILTFHWAVNYGAVLQAYALQKYLELQGHSVDIIDYKPLNEDISLKSILKYPRILASIVKHLPQRYALYKKDKVINEFRHNYLHLTQRCYSYNEVSTIVENYDVIVSGSDQVLNPHFALHGEKAPTSTYFLTFDNVSQKIGYAVSFGCENYPEEASKYVKQWISSFDKIGYRERSAAEIIHSLGYNKNVSLVPDPTILMGKDLFTEINFQLSDDEVPYTLLYLLHGHKISFEELLPTKRIVDIGQLDVPMEGWIQRIRDAKFVVTNSYHGMIMSILFHVPFVVLLEKGGLSGMNDRFITLLEVIGLKNRIVYDESDINRDIFNWNINWNEVEDLLSQYRKEGVLFLNV